MSTSYTFSGTDSYSVADVKTVMQNTYEDIIGFANKGMISYKTAESWIEDLSYILNQKVLDFFELQLYSSTGTWLKSYRYSANSFGYLSSGSSSGGINYYSIPDGSKVKLYAKLDSGKGNYQSVNDELNRRGWGIGSASEGSQTYERSYVSNSLELKRSVISK